MTTIVVTPIEFDGTEVEVHGDVYQHLFRAKRLRAGESVRVVDGAGRARRGVIALAGAVPPLEPRLRVELLVAPPRPERAAWLVEKATEVGVAAIHLVATDRSARDGAFGHAQLARLHRIAVGAVEQCGRAVVPDVTGLLSLPDKLALLTREHRPGVVLDAEGSTTAPDLPPAPDDAKSPTLTLIVGPEGGWTDEELARFDQANLPRWSLGPRALRVETAAVLAAGIVLAADAGR
jgi:16S rRNA (uracil1498-N3)-methyltransferase